MLGVSNRWTGIWGGAVGRNNWMEQWVKLTHVTGTVVQGCASYYVSRAYTSLQRPYEEVQCCQLSSTSWCNVQKLGSLKTRLLLRL